MGLNRMHIAVQSAIAGKWRPVSAKFIRKPPICAFPELLLQNLCHIGHQPVRIPMPRIFGRGGSQQYKNMTIGLFAIICGHTFALHRCEIPPVDLITVNVPQKIHASIDNIITIAVSELFS